MTRKLLILSALFLYPLFCFGADLEDAVKQVAINLKEQKIQFPQDQPLIIQVVNYHNQEQDQTAKKIEAELYLALEKQFKDALLISTYDSVLGTSLSKSIILKGSYEQTGTLVKLRFKAVQGLEGEIIAQTDTQYQTQKKVQRTLVAVLDIKAEHLNPLQKKAISDVFRAALAEINASEIASSADVDKMNPDEVQKATGCTRDECATIIGEQRGVDRAVSTSVFPISDDENVLSVKMINIKDGTIVVSKTIKFQPADEPLGEVLKKIASQIAVKPKTQQVTSGTTPRWVWHTTALTLALASAWQFKGQAASLNDLDSRNRELQTQLQNSVTLSKDTEIQPEFASNQSEIDQKKSQIQILCSFVTGV